MKVKFHEVLLMIFLIVVIPGWLYASGNFPSSVPCNAGMIMAVRYHFPRLSEATCDGVHMVYSMFRDFGIRIPFTHNERILSIEAIRLRTIEICDQILMDRRG